MGFPIRFEAENGIRFPLDTPAPTCYYDVKDPCIMQPGTPATPAARDNEYAPILGCAHPGPRMALPNPGGPNAPHRPKVFVCGPCYMVRAASVPNSLREVAISGTHDTPAGQDS